jgi:hypothetical protein
LNKAKPQRAYKRGFMEEALFFKIVQATGLPQTYVMFKLKELIIASGKNPQEITLEDLREAIVPLMQNIFSEVASGENEFIKLSD